MSAPALTLLRSPVIRMSLALVMFSCGLLLLSDLLGFFPNQQQALLEARKSIAETLAVQSVSAIEHGLESTVDPLFESIQSRDRSMRSIALRRVDGTLVAEAGGHADYWTLDTADTSTETQVRVPIHQRTGLWGSLEIVFKPLVVQTGSAGVPPSVYTVLGFFALAAFVAFVAFLRRALSELDPNAVIPQRVRSAFDALSEGLVILDTDERIMMANIAFANRLDRSAESLVGQTLSSLGWQSALEPDSRFHLPWMDALSGLEQTEPEQLRIETAGKQIRKLAVTAVGVTAPDGSIRGAMVSFSDLTDVERANSELKRTLQQLETMQRDMARQNQELLVLATRDPLTGVLNRRALFEAFDNLLGGLKQDARELCCIMIDIDKFKAINDRYGHGVGDKVIKTVAAILTDTARATDLVGRYGGEEFCVLLPETSLAQARDVAERIRLAIQNGNQQRASLPMQVTASLGVSTTASGIHEALELCNQADRALYMAKESGRNKVVTTLEMGLEMGQATPQTESTITASESARQVAAPTSTHREPDPALLARINELERALTDSERARAGAIHLTADPSVTSWSVLHDRLEFALRTARRKHGQGGVIAMATDNLGEIIAAYGQSCATRLLDAISTRIGEKLRDSDSVAVLNTDDPGTILVRQGQDELVLVLPELQDAVDASRVVQRIVATLTDPFVIDGIELFASPRFGVAIFPVDGDDATTLLSHANAALRVASQRSRGQNYRFYSDDLNKRAHEHLQIEAELRHAVERSEFVMHYQPRINVMSGRISGMEALIRWQHPRLGLVYPDRFIPLAERTGLIGAIGNWVIEAVCRQLRLWNSEGVEDLEVAINISPLQLDDEAFAHFLKSQVLAQGISPRRIELEITESVVIGNVEKVVALLQDLHAAGFNSALDDFGTGYASMSYLRNLPVNRIKIDRSFLAGIDGNVADYAIVASLIELGHSLEKRVVAEGVETEEQWLALRELGCDEAQGYFLSRPVDALAARELLRQGSPLRRKLHLIQGNNTPGIGTSQRTVIRGVLNHSGRHDATGRRSQS